MLNLQRKKLKKLVQNGKRRKPPTHKSKKLKILSFITGVALFFVILGLIGAFGVVAYFSKDLPSPGALSNREIPQTTKIFSRDSVLLYEIFGDERRTLVTLDDIPEFLKQATIAVEDADFYEHSGFDISGIIRGAVNTLQGEGLQGGSTITQQVVKNTLLTPERTITRKIKELILAIELERRYSKDEILQMYFNESPYGGQAWGVGAASEMYYGKAVGDLTIAEATLIAGLPQAPSVYSPCGAYPERAKDRQSGVLNLMAKNGFIEESEVQEILDTEVNIICFGYNQDDIKAPHFVMYVKSLLTEKYGDKAVEQGGLKVFTTLDYGKQLDAEETARNQIEYLQSNGANASNAGVITVDPTNGQILTMVGSVDYFDAEHDGNVNVLLAERQPGSSIKPITFLESFRQGYSPSTYVSDIRTCFPGGAGQPDYCPVNWDGKFWGAMNVRTALSNSRNIPAVKMLQVVGIDNVIDLSHDLGITSLNDRERYGLSLTLGGGEVRPIDMAQVFATFAALGDKHELNPILSVEDSSGNMLYEFKDRVERVVDPEYVYLLNTVLSDGNTRRSTFGNSLEIGRTLAVKTGTTNDNKDAWTIGFTPQLVTVVWVGNFNNDPMNGIMGSTGATPIMKELMLKYHDGTEYLDWEKPEKVIYRTVDSISGLIPQDGKGYPTRQDVFVLGSEPVKIDDFHISVQVCTDDENKLATEYHKDNNLVKERTYTFLKEIYDAWQPFTNEYMAARSADGFGNPPDEFCSISIDGAVVEGPVIQIDSPNEGGTITKLKFSVSANIYSSERITEVTFYWDDKIIGSMTTDPYEMEYKLSSMDKKYRTDGDHTIKVEALDSAGNLTMKVINIELDAVKDTVTPTPTKEVSPTPEDSGVILIEDEIIE